MNIIKYVVGDRVKFNMTNLKNCNANRCRCITWLSDSYLDKAKAIADQDQVGTVTREFHGFDFNVTFPDGSTFHAKPNYVDRVE